ETPNLMFSGNIDDFRIYNYELPGEEIIALYEDVQTGAEVVNISQTSNLNVYPVPASDVLKFHYSSRSLQYDIHLELYTIFGRLILEKKLENMQSGELDISGIPSGIYMLKISNSQEFVSKKVIV